MLLMSGIIDYNTSVNATYQIIAIEQNKNRGTECQPDYELFQATLPKDENVEDAEESRSAYHKMSLIFQVFVGLAFFN